MTEPVLSEVGPEAPPVYRTHHFEAPEICAPHNPGAFARWLGDALDAYSSGIAPAEPEPSEGVGRHAIASDRRLYRFSSSFHFTVTKGFTYDSYIAGRRHFGGSAVTRHEIIVYLFEKSGIEYGNRKRTTNALSALISRGAVERVGR